MKDPIRELLEQPVTTRGAEIALGRRLVELDSGLGLFRFIHLLDALHDVGRVGCVLSIGCGAGLHEYAIALSSPDTKVIGVDLVPPSVPELENLHFVRANLLCRRTYDTLPKPDFMLSIECLEHVANDQFVLDRLGALSEPGAHLYLQVPFANAVEQSDAELRERVRQTYGHLRVGYDSVQLARMVGHAGFEPLRSRGCFWFPVQPMVYFSIERFGVGAVAEHWQQLYDVAKTDLIDREGTSRNECCGLKLLARRR